MDGLRQVLSVLMVFALLGAALWKLRRGAAPIFRIGWNRIGWNRTGPRGRSLEQLEKLALTPQHTLHIVRVEGREILVATHPQGCTVMIGAGEEPGPVKHMPVRQGAGA
jgi:hypothetical protein